MSRPKDPRRYPLWCFDIADKLNKDRDFVFTIQCSSMREAKDFLLWFNSFKKAAHEFGWTDPHTENPVRFWPELNEYTCRAMDDPPRVQVAHRENSDRVKSWTDQILAQSSK